MKTSTIHPSRRSGASIIPSTARLDAKPVHPAPAANGHEHPPERPVTRPRLMVGPLEGTGEIIDVTQQVIGAIAQEIWKRSQGNDLLNWIEAERLFFQAMQEHEWSAAANPHRGGRHGR